jgi:hypothetical protein
MWTMQDSNHPYRSRGYKARGDLFNIFMFVQTFSWPVMRPVYTYTHKQEEKYILQPYSIFTQSSF